MPTMLYSPGLRVFIATASKGTIEVTDDVSQGSMTLSLGSAGGHKLQLTLTNQGRKYDGLFTPNDRIVVFLKRVRWLQCFSGYLDSVPVFNAYAKDVRLGASCTLKRLLYSLYDEGSTEFATLMNATSVIADALTSIDSNIGLKLVDVLTQLGGWDRDKIHIGAIPPEWFEGIAGVYEAIRPGLIPEGMAGAQIAGRSPLSDGVANYPNTGLKATGSLPARSGRVGVIGESGDPLPNFFDLSNEPGSSPNDIWYAAMRWPYRVESNAGAASAGLTAEEATNSRNWWREQRIMVMNPKTMKTIIVRPAHWGPTAASGRAIDLSPQALQELGLASGEYVQLAFAPIVASSSQGVQFAPLGVYVPKATPTPPRTAEDIVQDAVSRAVDRLWPGTRSPSGETDSGPIIGEDGVVFTARDNLKPNTAAAMDFVNLHWTVPGIGGWRADGSVPNSDHPKGLAIDISTGNGSLEPNEQQVALGNAIAYWFTQNPQVFGVRVVIWNNMIYSSAGAARYIHPSDADANDLGLSHRNHVHVSFYDTGQTSMGPTGDPFPVGVGDFLRTAAIGGIIHGDRATSIELPDGTRPGSGGFSGGSGTGPLIRTTFTAMGQVESTWLTGPRQLLNDVPLQPLVNELMTAGQRHYCSAPNGDIVAWFPDFFNLYGTCGRLVLQSIELDGFNVQWSDRSLVTHQFVTGSTPLGEFSGAVTPEQEFTYRKLFTHGVASIDFPEILRAILNIDSPTSAWTDTNAIYQRFGARVNAKTFKWASTPEVEFWSAVNLLRMSWASQFSSEFKIGFMPELFPGMILQIPEYGVQFYCDQVTHSWSLGPDGSGFETQVNVVAPSTIGDNPSLIGLPRGGRWIGSQQPTDVTLAGPRS